MIESPDRPPRIIPKSKYAAGINGFAVKLVIEKISFMPKLFMLLIGCTPADRHIEQHDVFFGIGESVKDLVPDLTEFWPGQNRLASVSFTITIFVESFLSCSVKSLPPTNVMRMVEK